MKFFLFFILFLTNLLVADPRLEFEQTALDKYVHSIDESFKAARARSKQVIK